MGAHIHSLGKPNLCQLLPALDQLGVQQSKLDGAPLLVRLLHGPHEAAWAA
jgi:hypothetical protein